jgi:mono/diheme cytochrome c family protein
MNTNLSGKSALRIAAATLFTATTLFVAGCDKTTEPKSTPGQLTRAELLAKGAANFSSCTGCHGNNGEGHSPHTPPLLYSDYLMAERMRPVRIMLLGLPNPIDTATTIVVNGVTYADYAMPDIGVGYSDTTIAALLTYIRVSLNDSSAVNCRAPSLDADNNPTANCDLVARPEAATDSVTLEEVAAVRAQLVSGGYLQ